MAFIEKIFFDISCDKCGKLSEDHDFHKYWSEKSDARKCMGHEGDWAIINPSSDSEMHYCPDCYKIVWDERNDSGMVIVDREWVGICRSIEPE